MKTIMVTDVFLSGFMLAYEFVYIWLVRKFDDYNLPEVIIFLTFILTKLILNLTASYTYATKIGWQLTNRVSQSTRWFRTVHL